MIQPKAFNSRKDSYLPPPSHQNMKKADVDRYSVNLTKPGIFSAAREQKTGRTRKLLEHPNQIISRVCPHSVTAGSLLLLLFVLSLLLLSRAKGTTIFFYKNVHI
ncbi:hypothetical protein ATANTOWER_025100 [Ataeniobius toweri]|uniref:Uncharacterized protein n=1 Tax=Ataeniobius toweri TaxID=208326 RepID=A0ABU7AW67_9TELE|nr:hypothetical protein [Ataeniobius toweri]